MSDKDKKSEPNSKDVTPIHNGKAQPNTSFEQAIIDLGNKHPSTWSIIRHD